MPKGSIDKFRECLKLSQGIWGQVGAPLNILRVGDDKELREQKKNLTLQVNPRLTSLTRAMLSDFAHANVTLL